MVSIHLLANHSRRSLAHCLLSRGALRPTPLNPKPAVVYQGLHTTDAYFLGFGAFSGACQFYAVQFWLHIQHNAPLTFALYFLPNAIIGVLATWVIKKTLHVIPGHFIYLAAMLAFALGPVFFLLQNSRHNILGIIVFRRSPRHPWSTSFLRSSLNLHHQQCATIIPRQCKQSPRYSAEPELSDYDLGGGRHWDQGG